ncbi:MAG TPA: enolase C-terminal domain-like protein, partial [Flavobacterium sp.]|nr:enolase C-terminal domain-like protein [Flavobacterium sp.]
MTATPHPYTLDFKVPSGTSRGVLTTKQSWFIVIEHEGKKGIGECGLLRGLSADDRPDYAAKLKWACDNLYLGEEALWEALREFPSIQFGVETAFRSWSADDPFELFPSAFTEGSATIPINGLVWMGSEAYMKEQIEAKIDAGFHCIKLKIGALGFQKEWGLLRSIRDHFSPNEIEIRVDANGAFRPNEALEKLYRLADLGIHSIEQPIATKQWTEMERLCRATPIPIALDEELIGLFDTDA